MMIKTLCSYIQLSFLIIVLGKKFVSTDLRELRLRIGECSSEIRDIIHNYETVKDIVISGRFASIGLYETPASRDHQRAAYLLDFFELSDKSDRRFVTLSDGEKQKVLLARALEMCTKKGGPALIYITHHIEEIVPAITHALTLRKGSVIASGRKEDVPTNEVQ